MSKKTEANKVAKTFTVTDEFKKTLSAFATATETQERKSLPIREEIVSFCGPEVDYKALSFDEKSKLFKTRLAVIKAACADSLGKRWTDKVYGAFRVSATRAKKDLGIIKPPKEDLIPLLTDNQTAMLKMYNEMTLEEKTDFAEMANPLLEKIKATERKVTNKEEQELVSNNRAMLAIAFFNLVA